MKSKGLSRRLCTYTNRRALLRWRVCALTGGVVQDRTSGAPATSGALRSFLLHLDEDVQGVHLLKNTKSLLSRWLKWSPRYILGTISKLFLNHLLTKNNLFTLNQVTWSLGKITPVRKHVVSPVPALDGPAELQ